MRSALRPLPMICLLTAIGFAALAIGSSWTSRTAEQAARAAQMDASAASLDRVVERVEALLTETVLRVDTLAAELARGAVSAATIEARLAAEADSTTLHGLTVAYAPDAAGTDDHLFAWARGFDGDVAPYRVDALGDYTEPDQHWYRDALSEGAVWRESPAGQGDSPPLAIYSAPFTPPGDDTPQGVVAASIDLGTLWAIVDEIGVGHRGYAFMFSDDGRWLVHPIEEWVRTGATVHALDDRRSDAALHDVAIRGQRGEGGAVERLDPHSGHPGAIVFEPIPTSGWTVGAVVIHDPPADSRTVRAGLIQVMLAEMAALAFGCGWIFLVFFGRRSPWWPVSIGLTILLIVGVGRLWSIAGSWRTDETAKDALALGDAPSAERQLDAWRQRTGEALVAIPTGVFVESITFDSAYDVKITGIIWQRYHDVDHAGLTRKVELPEADPDALTMDEIYRRYDAEALETLIGWRFSAALRQQFNYDKYPFDAQDAWLRMLPADFHRNVVLIPDFAAYGNTAPSSRPGVELDLVLPGWSVDRSRFEYRLHDYDTNFGLPDYVGQRGFPEMYFSVRVVRAFIGPFVSNVIPPTVVAIMLFAILLIGTKPDGDAPDWFGFSAKDVVLACAALFFVVIVDHANLRDRLAASRLLYFEVYYFTLYIALTAVTVNALLFATDRYRWVQFRDNLIPKVLFWPLCLGGVFVTTLAVFY